MRGARERASALNLTYDMFVEVGEVGVVAEGAEEVVIAVVATLSSAMT